MKKKIAAALAALMCLTAAAGLSSCGDKGGENGEVRVYCFGDYIDTVLIDEFEEETGISVVLDTFDTNEEMYPVISKNSVDYDVICASDYMIEKMIGEGLLAELNKDNLSNLSNIDSKYMEIAADFDPGNKYSVPHTWGTMGIMYNTAEIEKGSITSWNDLWDEKYKDQIVMPDSLRDTIAVALKAKGYSINTMDESELSEAVEYLKEQKPLVYKYANDSARDMVIGGSANIAVVWNGEILYSQDLNPDLDFVIPDEGSEQFLDMWAVPETAKNKENAEAWINFMLEKENAITNYEYLTYSIPNTGVMEMLEGDEDKLQYLFPADEILARCEVLKSLGAEGDDMYSSYWKEFKAE